ncbi:Sterile alpha motif domain-containing protein 3 [Merluccius polli]|uniref:Sterile alpha motif domain-containing protein 3 n=1 Tax=Merluccius polli TaxID=89951 RepID=A0AA47NWF1_MERPO|nr:Sterile alpha motif domain-containing protein 3 [Merluccius polli]
MTEALKLRVILDDVNAERLILPSRPETVNALIFEVKNKLNLAYDFRLQFQDPEFDNALCNLVNMEDLPSKATIKIVQAVESDLTQMTVLLSDNTDSPERICRWPEIFVVPTFSYEVEYALREGNSAFVKEGKTVRLTRDQKHNILDVMAGDIYKHKAYPSTKQISKAAEALVSKHLCLKENGSRTGYEGWKNSLRFKMGNYRTKLSRAGIKDVAVNAGKHSKTNPEGAAARTKIKRPKRGEVNFLPNYPHGETKDTLETQRIEMVEQFKKTSIERDMILIHQPMQRTFALRREEIVNSAPPIAELKVRWPALFCEAQLYGEFHRITNQNLPFSFYTALDKYTPQLLKLYRKRKTGSFGEKMDEVLMAYEEQEKNITTGIAALAGLPLYLKEDSTEIFKTCKDELEATQEAAVALVAVVNEDEVPAGVPFETHHVSIVLEIQVVMAHRSWADSLVILFGLIYALHLSYPEKLSGFFEFIQVILLSLDDGRKQLKPKLQALKNELE